MVSAGLAESSGAENAGLELRSIENPVGVTGGTISRNHFAAAAKPS
jgi:hypothetical protein